MFYFLSFLWWFAEWSLFFIIPDVILTYIAFFYWIKKWLKASLFAVLWAILWWSLIYFYAKFGGDYHFLEKIPLINEKMILLVKTYLSESLTNIVYWPLNWIPYKIYAWWFGYENISYLKFIFLSFIARIWRFVLVVFIAWIIWKIFNKYKKYKLFWHIVFILVWILIYWLYTMKILEVYY